MVVLAVHVRSADLADELAGPGDGRPAGVQVVDAVAATAGLEVGVVVGVAGVLDGVGVDLAERVAHPDAQQRFADRPRDDLVHALVQPDGLLGVVEARGLVEVAGQEDRVPLAEQRPDVRGEHLDRAGAYLVLGGQHLVDRLPVEEQPRPVPHVVEVGVEHRHDVARLHLDERVQTIGAGRLVDGVLREQLEAEVVVGVPRPLGDLREAVVGLEDADDIGTDVLDHRVGVLVPAVLDVVGEDAELHLVAGRQLRRAVTRRLGVPARRVGVLGRARRDRHHRPRRQRHPESPPGPASCHLGPSRSDCSD